MCEPGFKFYDGSLLDSIQRGDKHCWLFFRLLSLCHTVMPETDDDGKKKRKGIWVFCKKNLSLLVFFLLLFSSTLSNFCHYSVYIFFLFCFPLISIFPAYSLGFLCMFFSFCIFPHILFCTITVLLFHQYDEDIFRPTCMRNVCYK